MDDLDVHRSAKLLLDSKGENAPAHARKRITNMTVQGYTVRRAAWLRFAAAMEVLRTGVGSFRLHSMDHPHRSVVPVTDNVIQFPPRQRVARPRLDAIAQEDATLVLVEHNGRAYLLPELMRRLSPAELKQVEAAAPRTGQAMWDEVVRRWPALAAEIAAGVQESP